MFKGHLVTLFKTLTYRVLGTAYMFVVAFVLGGTLGTAVGVASIEVVVKTTLYYVHERAWAYAKA